VVAEPAAAAAPIAVAAPEPGKPVRVRYFGRTDVGLVREHNEDNFLVVDLAAGKRGVESPREVTITERGCIFAVCDGMGGAAAGEVASQMAVDTIHEVFSQGSVPADRDAFARRLVHAIEEAGHRIFSAAKMDRSRRGMGTTTTLAGLVDNVLFVGQVGDSRAYVLRAGQLEQITKDQSLVNQLIEAGQLTEEEAEAFEHSNIILQALGTTEEVTVDLTFLELRRGDRLLLCSDGLSGLVHSEMIRDVLAGSEGLDEAAAKLIQMANAGGGHDNISVILAEFDGEGLKAAEDVRALYQQYPLPPDDTSRGQALTPRDTSMKAGGPKPGADVKRDEGPHATELQPAQGGSRGMIVVIGLLLIVLLAVGAYFVFAHLGAQDAQVDHDPAGTSEPATTIEPANEPEQPEPPEEPQQAQPTEPARGAVHVDTDVDDGTIFVNGESRGALTSGMTLELAPGVYTIEARSGDAQVATETVTVTAGGDATIALNRPAIPDPQTPESDDTAQHPRHPTTGQQPGGPQVRPLNPHPRNPRPGGNTGAPPANPF
jgi:serine/threonine protein phosphatase PrpC